LAFAYGGIAQIIAGVLEFRNGNTFGTVAFTSYGLFWWWYAFLLWTVGRWLAEAARRGCRGAHASDVGRIHSLHVDCDLPRQPGVWTVFLLLWITFFLLAAADLGMGTGWRAAGGWVGLFTGLAALYVSFAEVTNATFGKNVIPLGAPILKAPATY
jgi:succinate-acetate transporter protein